MKMSAAEKKIIKKALVALDTRRLLEGLGRSATRGGGLGIITDALAAAGYDLALIHGALSGDSGSRTLLIEKDGSTVDNAAVAYSWHDMGNDTYEIVAYLS